MGSHLQWIYWIVHGESSGSRHYNLQSVVHINYWFYYWTALGNSAWCYFSFSILTLITNLVHGNSRVEKCWVLKTVSKIHTQIISILFHWFALRDADCETVRRSEHESSSANWSVASGETRASRASKLFRCLKLTCCILSSTGRVRLVFGHEPSYCNCWEAHGQNPVEWLDW